MQENDIYVVDTRNADHRTPQQGAPWFRPNQPIRTMTAQPAQVYSQPTAPQQPQIIYAVPPAQHQAPTSHLLHKINGPVLIDLVAQVFAALMPLPAAPVATSEVATDVQNMLLYHSALAQYAKRDEQLRTLGNLITKVL